MGYLFFVNATLETSKNVQEVLKLNGTHQLLVCVDIYLFGENRKIIKTNEKLCY
jgi:hypothetical protein